MEQKRLIILTVLLCCAAASCLLAAPADEDPEKHLLSKGPGQGSDKAGSDWPIVMVALAVVVAAAYLLLRLLRKLAPNLAPVGGKNAPFETLARFPLAPRQSLHLIRFGRRLFLLGATSAGINHLATIDDTAEIEQILQAVSRGESPLTGLSRFLHRSSMQQEPDRQHSDETSQTAKDSK